MSMKPEEIEVELEQRIKLESLMAQLESLHYERIRMKNDSVDKDSKEFYADTIVEKFKQEKLNKEVLLQLSESLDKKEGLPKPKA